MKLTYNGLKLHLLFSYVRCTGDTAQGDPAESPKRYKRTLTFEGDVNEETFADNRGLIDNVRAAFATGKGNLKWEDDKPGVQEGTLFLNRTVDIVEHNLPAEPNARGRFWQQLRFTVSFWENNITSNTLTAQFRRNGAESTAPWVDLMDVDSFEDSYASELMNRMRDVRSYVGGRVNIRGRIKLDTTSGIINRRVALAALERSLITEFSARPMGRLRYGREAVGGIDAVTEKPYPAENYVFDATVRVIDFVPRLHETQDYIEYSLTATYTRYPNETDYAVAQYKMARNPNHEDGTETLVLSGRIAAPTEAVARLKLAQLRTLMVAGGSYVLANEQGDTENGSSDQNVENFTKVGDGDGAAFFELLVNDVYRKHTGGITSWSLRTATMDAANTGMVRYVYSGTVHCFGATDDAAYAVAVAKAAELGANKRPMLISSSITQPERQHLTDGKCFIAVDFSYEYLSRGLRTWLEVRSELVEDRFGETIENVSGTIQAPDLTTAQSAYESLVRNLPTYASALLLNERTPQASYQRIVDDDSLDEAFTFSFSVHRSKTISSCTYKVTVDPQILEMRAITNVSGKIWASDETVAEAYLEALLSTLGLVAAQKISGPRSKSFRKGRNVIGSADVAAFIEFEFSENYETKLTGVNGLLQTRVSEVIKYTGDRVVERPIVGGASQIQKTGRNAARRTVSVMVRATTDAACDAYVRKILGLMVTGANKESPEIRKDFVFVPRVEGLPSSNANYSEWNASQMEMITELNF